MITIAGHFADGKEACFALCQENDFYTKPDGLVTNSVTIYMSAVKLSGTVELLLISYKGRSLIVNWAQEQELKSHQGLMFEPGSITIDALAWKVALNE